MFWKQTFTEQLFEEVVSNLYTETIFKSNLCFSILLTTVLKVLAIITKKNSQVLGENFVKIKKLEIPIPRLNLLQGSLLEKNLGAAQGAKVGQRPTPVSGRMLKTSFTNFSVCLQKLLPKIFFTDEPISFSLTFLVKMLPGNPLSFWSIRVSSKHVLYDFQKI